MTQAGVKTYVVPALDDEMRQRYLLVQNSNPELAQERAENWVKVQPGWKVTGKAIEGKLL
jgi:hypothetical protein